MIAWWQAAAIVILLAPHAIYAATALRRRRYGYIDHHGRLHNGRPSQTARKDG